MHTDVYRYGQRHSVKIWLKVAVSCRTVPNIVVEELPTPVAVREGG